MHPFKDPCAVKERKTSRDFVAPTKEQATTGRFMPPGDDYGVGHRTPVGKFKASPMSAGPIPQKNICVDPNEI
jgi:hypothetical protein